MEQEDSKAGPPTPETTIGNTQLQHLSKDAQGLGPICAGSFVIGHVDQIVGEGGVELPGFVPTKYELLQLVRYWAMEIIDLDFTFFCMTAQGRRSGATANLPTGGSTQSAG